MHAYHVTELQHELHAGPEQYLEFLRVPSLSMGLYELTVGSQDPQQPHTEDEIYYVVSGEAIIRVGDEDCPVRAGSVIYVAANMEHHFHTITQDISVLVFFAPAEYSATA